MVSKIGLSRRCLTQNINDLPEVISEDTSIRLFADDCLAYRKIQTVNDQKILQEDLEKLHQWTVL